MIIFALYVFFTWAVFVFYSFFRVQSDRYIYRLAVGVLKSTCDFWLLTWSGLYCPNELQGLLYLQILTPFTC